MKTNKQWKRVPFNIELAKKIQSGKVEGRIVNVTTEEISYTKYGSTLIDTHKNTYIELSEETPNLESVSKYLEELSQKKEAALERWYKSQETPKHEFKPFDKVLVRNFDSDSWEISLYAEYDSDLLAYVCLHGFDYKQCIPYEGNEHLVGTTDNPE